MSVYLFVVISCGDPGIPANGTRIGSTFTFDSTVNYTCDDGFKLIGDIRRNCLSSGNWSGDLPTCQSKLHNEWEIFHINVLFQNFVFSTFLFFDQLSTVEIQENPLMELELVVSLRLEELSDIDVTRDINYQGPPTEHVKHLEDGLVIKPYVKVKLYGKYNFYGRHERKFIFFFNMSIVGV